MTALLASVRALDEARLALAGDVDFIDLKNPDAGALGALPEEVLRSVVDEVAGRRPVSATAGDLPMQPELIVRAVMMLDRAGVDYAKIGFFPGGDWTGVLDALAGTAFRARRVAVLFAEEGAGLAWVEPIARAGFAGVMLDTRMKGSGSLRAHLAEVELAAFVAAARGAGLLCGLAGSLGLDDIAPLCALGPDYLGFRGALCVGQERTARLDAAALAAVRRTLREQGDRR